MDLQTKIPLPKQAKNLIDYNSKILLIGSCFVENIGQKFDYYKFQNLQNPFGILFHPLALENLITNVINEKVYNEDDIFHYNEQWHCYNAHSKLSSSLKDELLDNLNESINITSKQLKNTTHIVITLGTAWVYRHIDKDEIVANCHKIPQKKFVKELLSVNAISESLDAIIKLIRTVNLQASILFTISPVRHIKEGFVQSTLSKSHLIAAVHQVVEPRKKVFYFPAYEIILDELRDYRFYNEDMVHPNQIAVNYIWEKFMSVWVSEDALNVMEDINLIQKGLQHRPFNSTSIAHQKFLNNIKEKKNDIQSKFDHIKF